MTTHLCQFIQKPTHNIGGHRFQAVSFPWEVCVCVSVCRVMYADLSSFQLFENNPKMTLSILYSNVSMSMPFNTFFVFVHLSDTS